MKIIFAALASLTTVCASKSFLRLLQMGSELPPPMEYNENLKCDQCIRSNFTFCIQAQERDVINGTDPAPNAKCCQDATCAEASSAEWNCSSSYSDPILARSICPFRRDQCGDHPQVLLNNTGDAVNLNMTIPPGGMCMVEMRAKCGLPAFKPNSTDGLDIQYYQYDDVDSQPVQPNQGGQQGPNQNGPPPPPNGGNNASAVDDTFRRPPKNQTPPAGSPPQNRQQQNQQQGGQQPGGPQNGQNPPPQGQNPPPQGQNPPPQGQNPPPQGQNPPPQGGQGQQPPNGNQTQPQQGPKAGRYDPAQGGAVKYDQPSQSDSRGAPRRNSSDPVCRGRNMIIVVSNTNNETSSRILSTEPGSISVNLNIQSQEFSAASVLSIFISFVSLVTFAAAF